MRFSTFILLLMGILPVSAANGDIRKTYVDGLEWTYSILSENNKTCEVGAVTFDSWGDESGVPAIDVNTTGAISIPSALNDYTVVAIGLEAFRESKISSVTVPNSVVRIEEKAFSECENLSSVKLPEGLTFIGEEVFSECPISAITLPESLVRIGEQAFEQTLLTTIFLPKNVAFLGNEDRVSDSGDVIEEDDVYGDVFNGCDLLAEVKVDEANNTYTDVDGVLLTKDKKTLLYFPPAARQSVIPEGVEEIIANVFEESKLTSISFPSTLRKIGEYAFSRSALKEVIIGYFGSTMAHAPARLSSSSSPSITIDQNAFYSCKDLKTVSLGENVSEIQSDAFALCSNLTDVYNFSSVPQTIDENTFAMDFRADDYWMNFYPVCTATLHVLEGCQTAYENAPGWNIFNQIVEDANGSAGIGVLPTTSTIANVESYYTLMGTRTSGQKGLVIYKMSDGTCRKVLLK